jgi:ribosomal protein S18 acetylase RimI-like enzyme
VPVTIAIAGPDDVEELTAAFERLIPHLSRSNPPPARDAVAEILASPATTQFLARDGDGTIVGVATLVTFRIPTGLRAWIEDVVADPAAAGQGLGRALTEAMLAEAARLGCTTVDLTSRPTREAANHIYRSVGFQPRETNVYRYSLEQR